MFYAEEYQPRRRESLRTKDEAEARRLIAARNQAATQPVFNVEMTKASRVGRKAAHLLPPGFCGAFITFFSRTPCIRSHQGKRSLKIWLASRSIVE